MADDKIVMENDINIAKILIDKPLGTKLYADAFGELSLLRYIDAECELSITLTDKNGFDYYFYNNGKYSIYGEPIVFPSKEMRDWSRFAWKKGDILISSDGGAEVIFDKWYDDTYTSFYCKHYLNSEDETKFVYYEEFICTTERYAIEDKDKAQIYIGIIEERLGGKLNCETLEIEKTQPEFKDGDIVIYGKSVAICRKIYKHTLSFYVSLNEMFGLLFADEVESSEEYRFATEAEKQQLFSALENEGKAWDAVKKQIVDLKPKWTPKPFDRVITRTPETPWTANFFSHIDSDGIKNCIDDRYIMCLPYNDETAKLIGTTNNWRG